jgi:hypothetical protein
MPLLILPLAEPFLFCLVVPLSLSAHVINTFILGFLLCVQQFWNHGMKYAKLLRQIRLQVFDVFGVALRHKAQAAL